MAIPRVHPTPDEVRLPLLEVRRGLLRLHKALLEAERRVFERDRGALAPAQLLQALLEEPFFAWLRAYSALIVEIDEALAGREAVSAEQARGYVAQARALATPGRPGRYGQVIAHDPVARSAHEELHLRIRAVLD